jgi:hypothetical protein
MFGCWRVSVPKSVELPSTETSLKSQKSKWKNDEQRYYLNLYGSLILFGAGKACCNETLRKGTNTILALNRFLIYVRRPKAMVDESHIYICINIYIYICIYNWFVSIYRFDSCITPLSKSKTMANRLL